jgi:glycosyltransferase involved in cell wall biosynthesis
VANCRFGIHGMLDEHFGIAPAELLRAGCIVFVPDSGGQVEIVGDHPELRYDSDDDAVEKICQVLADQETESRLRMALSERSELFSETQFMKNISNVVDDFTRKIR